MTDRKRTVDVNHSEESVQSAGCFSSWLRRTRAGLIRERDAQVPCGSCNVCCASSYFIHIRPDEKLTRARIDKRLLFPAPGMAKGNVLMGYNEQGACPMLVEGRCTIYEVRPQTCRNYDCRIFAAAGIAAGEEDKARINRQVKQWRFDYPTARDREQHEAVRAAARFLLEKASVFPDGAAPKNPSQVAILAIKVYGVFLGEAALGRTDAETAGAIMEANGRFEAKRLSDGCR